MCVFFSELYFLTLVTLIWHIFANSFKYLSVFC